MKDRNIRNKLNLVNTINSSNVEVIAVLRQFKIALFSLASAFVFMFAGAAQSAPIDIVSVFSQPSFGIPGGTITETGSLADATDGDLTTGLLVSASPGTVGQATGARVRLDFDVSGYSSISSFTFNFDGIHTEPTGQDLFQLLRIGANPSFSSVSFATPNGALLSSSLTLTPGAAASANNLDNYITGGILSVWLASNFGTGPASLIGSSINILEVSGDIVGVVPLPAAIWLFGTAFIGLIGFGRRRKAGQV